MHDHVRVRPKLIITCGLIGTGKSTIAQELAETKGWTMVSSDSVRKELAKVPVTQHEYVAFEKGIYSGEFTAKTYERMNQVAEQLLKEGRSVVMDASFAKKKYRAETYALAKRLDAEITCIELVCPEEEIKRRLASRMKQEKQVSDGRWEIFSQMKVSFEEIDEFTDEEHIVVDTSNPKEESVARALKMIDKRCRGS